MYGWKHFEPWSPTETIHRRVITGLIEIKPFFLDIECHILILDHHRYKGSTLIVSLFNCIDARDTCSIQNASMERGAQCYSFQVPGYTQNSGSNVVDCRLLSPIHLI